MGLATFAASALRRLRRHEARAVSTPTLRRPPQHGVRRKKKR